MTRENFRRRLGQRRGARRAGMWRAHRKHVRAGADVLSLSSLRSFPRRHSCDRPPEACGRDAGYMVMQRRSRLRRAAGKKKGFLAGPCTRFGRALATCAIWVGPRSKCTQQRVQNGVTERGGLATLEHGKNFHPYLPLRQRYHRTVNGCAGRACLRFFASSASAACSECFLRPGMRCG